ncbi:hypothetical protein BU16DRAFT_52185 [Lophium mytilinum]|uniref:Metal tolerance protein 3 n=1 Tax=Lophium mytilinum TaxID=390894 RepID=A0A6A6QPQ0_9PEZI|nr:hypothetical protein BU16DRAFT_52185 [Lophium mytilinum]
MQNSMLTNLIILLSLFHITVLAGPTVEKYPAILAVRQTTSNPQCGDYSRIANLSTIGKNSTYRSLFLQASPRGTFADADMLNAAIAKLPTLTKDAGLNKACGNLTTVAFVEAEKNFTEGVVAQFSGLVPTGITAGPEVALIVGFIVVGFCGMFIFV